MYNIHSTAFYSRMDQLAKVRFDAAGLEFPDDPEVLEEMYTPVYDRLINQGLIISAMDGQLELFPTIPSNFFATISIALQGNM